MNTSSAQPAAEAIVNTAPALAPSMALFLDIDGTLVHLAEHPDAIRIEARLRTLLERVRGLNGGALALISGRSIDSVDALFAPSRFAIAGQHGVERRSVDGTLHRHAPVLHRLHEAAAEMRALAARHPGLLLEEKGASLALHYRAQPALGEWVAQECRRLLAFLGDDFGLQSGKFVWEIKPNGKDKGTAIAEFLAEPPFVQRLPVFVGDDDTDEYGFDLANQRGGVSVKVGAGPTRALWRLRDADAVGQWLADFVAKISSGDFRVKTS